MERLGDFELPGFFNDPSYFTLQPEGDARQAQIRACRELILDYCRSKRIYYIDLEQEFPLFSNPVIERSICPETTEVFLSALVMEGSVSIYIYTEHIYPDVLSRAVMLLVQDTKARIIEGYGFWFRTD